MELEAQGLEPLRQQNIPPILPQRVKKHVVVQRFVQIALGSNVNAVLCCSDDSDYALIYRTA